LFLLYGLFASTCLPAGRPGLEFSAQKAGSRRQEAEGRKQKAGSTGQMAEEVIL
jgi:hypothetical protein